MKPLFNTLRLFVSNISIIVIPECFNRGSKILLIFCFLLSNFQYTHAQDLQLPAPGVRVGLSQTFNPPVLKGITVHPNNPFKFDFILDQGDSLPLVGRAREGVLKSESEKLVKYFLAAITTPEKDIWVNLSPYEKDRIIPESFGQTAMGRDLLAQDYLLKQITASLIYPEDDFGKKFWQRIYAEAAKKYGNTQIPVNTFNKVWIVPDKAKVYEHGSTAFVVNAKLKVMLEEDYMATQKNGDVYQFLPASLSSKIGERPHFSAIVREIILPELEREINQGQNFAPLRQVYHSLILAVWFKKRMKDSILGQKYMDQNKSSNLSSPNAVVGNPERIYQQYLQAFKKGVYNYIKEETDPITQQVIPRKYFSGGFAISDFVTRNIDYAQSITLSEVTVPDALEVSVDLSVNMEQSSKVNRAMIAKLFDFFEKIFEQKIDNAKKSNNQGMSRRDFLKRSTVAAAATALAPGITSLETIVGAPKVTSLVANETGKTLFRAFVESYGRYNPLGTAIQMAFMDKKKMKPFDAEQNLAAYDDLISEVSTSHNTLAELMSAFEDQPIDVNLWEDVRSMVLRTLQTEINQGNVSEEALPLIESIQKYVQDASSEQMMLDLKSAAEEGLNQVAALMEKAKAARQAYEVEFKRKLDEDEVFRKRYDKHKVWEKEREEQEQQLIDDKNDLLRWENEGGKSFSHPQIQKLIDEMEGFEFPQIPDDKIEAQELARQMMDVNGQFDDRMDALAKPLVPSDRESAYKDYQRAFEDYSARYWSWREEVIKLQELKEFEERSIIEIFENEGGRLKVNNAEFENQPEDSAELSAPNTKNDVMASDKDTYYHNIGMNSKNQIDALYQMLNSGFIGGIDGGFVSKGTIVYSTDPGRYLYLAIKGDHIWDQLVNRNRPNWFTGSDSNDNNINIKEAIKYGDITIMSTLSQDHPLMQQLVKDLKDKGFPIEVVYRTLPESVIKKAQEARIKSNTPVQDPTVSLLPFNSDQAMNMNFPTPQEWTSEYLAQAFPNLNGEQIENLLKVGPLPALVFRAQPHQEIYPIDTIADNFNRWVLHRTLTDTSSIPKPTDNVYRLMSVGNLNAARIYANIYGNFVNFGERYVTMDSLDLNELEEYLRQEGYENTRERIAEYYKPLYMINSRDLIEAFDKNTRIVFDQVHRENQVAFAIVGKLKHPVVGRRIRQLIDHKSSGRDVIYKIEGLDHEFKEFGEIEEWLKAKGFYPDEQKFYRDWHQTHARDKISVSTGWPTDHAMNTPQLRKLLSVVLLAVGMQHQQANGQLSIGINTGQAQIEQDGLDFLSIKSAFIKRNTPEQCKDIVRDVIKDFKSQAGMIMISPYYQASYYQFFKDILELPNVDDILTPDQKMDLQRIVTALEGWLNHAKGINEAENMNWIAIKKRWQEFAPEHIKQLQPHSDEIDAYAPEHITKVDSLTIPGFPLTTKIDPPYPDAQMMLLNAGTILARELFKDNSIKQEWEEVIKYNNTEPISFFGECYMHYVLTGSLPVDHKVPETVEGVYRYDALNNTYGMHDFFKKHVFKHGEKILLPIVPKDDMSVIFDDMLFSFDLLPENQIINFKSRHPDLNGSNLKLQTITTMPENKGYVTANALIDRPGREFLDNLIKVALEEEGLIQEASRYDVTKYIIRSTQSFNQWLKENLPEKLASSIDEIEKHIASIMRNQIKAALKKEKDVGVDIIVDDMQRFLQNLLEKFMNDVKKEEFNPERWKEQLEKNIQEVADPAMLTKGGIDLTSERMNLDVDSDKAQIGQPMDLKILEGMEIDSLYIKNIKIKPLNNLPQLLGLSNG